MQWNCRLKKHSQPMNETGCSGLVHWDDPERWDGEAGERWGQERELSDMDRVHVKYREKKT